MDDPTVSEMIAALRAETAHYGGSGGAAGLADDLGVHPQTLKSWRAGRLPSYAHRRALRALWDRQAAPERRQSGDER